MLRSQAAEPSALDMARFAQVLAEIGDFGRFQVQLVILLSVPSFLCAYYMFAQVFMTQHETHHCSVAWVKNHTLNLSAAEQLALSVPLDAAGKPEPCLVFRPPPDHASLADVLGRHLNETQPCEAGWEYPEARPPSLKNEVGLPPPSAPWAPAASWAPASALSVWGGCPRAAPKHPRVRGRPLVRLLVSLGRSSCFALCPRLARLPSRPHSLSICPFLPTVWSVCLPVCPVACLSSRPLPPACLSLSPGLPSVCLLAFVLQSVPAHLPVSPPTCLTSCWPDVGFLPSSLSPAPPPPASRAPATPHKAALALPNSFSQEGPGQITDSTAAT